MAHQGGHVKGGREPRLAVVEQVAKARVGLLAGAVAGELAHRPQAPAVHGWVDAAREGEGARPPDWISGAAGALRQVVGGVELADGLARERAKALVCCARVSLARRTRLAGPRPVAGGRMRLWADGHGLPILGRGGAVDEARGR